MGLLSTAAKVAVASSVHGRVQRRQQEKWAAQDAQRANSGPAGGPGALDVTQQLALIGQLNELRQAGALSDAGVRSEEGQDPRELIDRSTALTDEFVGGTDRGGARGHDAQARTRWRHAE